ncbi:hypothetical protein BK187_15025 [Brucella melitensis]|uniref:ABC transporter ATP-binding protein n=1 Tax=Brucella melitensis TaxID=29459 RepID=A0AB36PVW1_BRUML|nr:hypothetical protein ADS42_014900 [Brucella melitensis]ENS72897.1 hypothetical protein C059_02102 [Brucella melitensis UK23/06]ENS86057.1 hypothetical protein B984_02397 [Brucella melitensis UK31/99]ARY01055.1 hypothetical protein BK201_15025 [Brucella melitensis]ARY04244.1 hypothetical protein BK186_15035 [Brucella melitensis]
MQAASLPFNEIRLERMSRAFGSHNALKSITLSISKGEFIALLGPFGLRKINGFELYCRSAGYHRWRRLYR